jgi:hypothetical protein
MEIGDMMDIQVVFYIEKKTYAILKTQYKMSVFTQGQKLFYYENVSASYKELNGKHFLSNLEIVNKSKLCNLYTYFSIDFSNIKIKKEVNRINSNEIFDRKNPMSIPHVESISIDEEDWKRINDSDILKPLIRLNN